MSKTKGFLFSVATAVAMVFTANAFAQGSGIFSSTECKDPQNRILFCQWVTGCFAIDSNNGMLQTCDELISNCNKDGTRDNGYGPLYTGVTGLNESNGWGEGLKCADKGGVSHYSNNGNPVDTQGVDIAYVPFVVNVNAIATARLNGIGKFEKLARAGRIDTLLIITERESTPLARQGKTPSPVAMHSSRGKISLELSRQLYRNTDIALYSLNGKQILHGKAVASEAVKSISHPNVAMGVYLLSVKGVNGGIFTTRLAHAGGGLNIDVAFANENPVSLMKSISGNWTITVSAYGYLDTSYAFVPEIGRGNTEVQNITLRQTPVTLACATVPSSGYAAQPITPPALTCSNGATATGISWLGSPAINWSNPASGTYSSINAMATCGTTANLMASCPGELIVQPAISCNMASITGYEGTAIAQPAVACSDGSVPSGIVLSGQPDWDNPLAGSYEVYAEADCGFGTLSAVSCGTLTVSEVTLTCGNVPASGYEGTAISPPALTCSHGALDIPAWTNAPDWSNPVHGTYSNINATANCGLATKTADCNGTLTVAEVTFTCGSVPAGGISGLAIAPPVLTCSYGTLGTPVWANAPDWSDPAPGAYSDISVTATCGLAAKTADCNGTLNVSLIEYGLFTDSRDNQTYKTVSIGNQTWMARNLNYNATNSKCNGDNTGGDSRGNCVKYGRLYTWYMAMNLPNCRVYCSSQIQPKHQGVCPDGWHLPSREEWQTLIDFAGDSSKKLKATSGWNWNTSEDISGNGTDEYGFSALPGGAGGSSGTFSNFHGYWWSSREVYDGDGGIAISIEYNYPNFSTIFDRNFTMYSVRCLQDYLLVTATANSESSITLRWKSLTDATVYYIYRSTTFYGTYDLVGTSATTSYADNSLSSGTEYYYKVVAYDSEETSTPGYASYASATTFLPAVSTCDGMEGTTVTIGTQTWMKKNLNCDVNGSICNIFVTSTYECDTDTYGRLYTWAMAMNLPSFCDSIFCPVQLPHKGICPSGWHLPSNEEWQTLIDFAGGSSAAGKKLKATSGWSDNGGTDNYGFSAMPGGGGWNDGGLRLDLGGGYWWTASEFYSNGNPRLAYQPTKAYHWRMLYDEVEYFENSRGKSTLFSVRCLQD